MKKLKKFLTVGALSIVGTLFVGLTVGLPVVTSQAKMFTWQDIEYDNKVTKPIERFQSYFGVKNEVKAKYENILEENKKLLEEINLPKEIVETKVILKNQTEIDRMLHPLVKYGYNFYKLNEEQRFSSDLKYEGKTSYYLNYKEEDYIMLGLNTIENSIKKKEKDHYTTMFGYDEGKIFSYIFFHEIGHKISKTIKEEENSLNKILGTFEKEKGIVLSESDKSVIKKQYSETFADSFALCMTVKKYPELDFEKTKNMIAGYRMVDHEPTHFTSPGVIAMKDLNCQGNMQDILLSAEKSALVTTQFYSEIDFSKVTYYDHFSDSERKLKQNQPKGREVPVEIIDLDVMSVKGKMREARIKFLAEGSNNKNKNGYSS